MVRFILAVTGVVILAVLVIAVRADPHAWSHLLQLASTKAQHYASNLNHALPSPRSTP